MTIRNPQHITIIGGGLAGTFTAARLLDAGHAVRLFDDARPHAPSRVAAGLFNVITGRFGAKSWMADTLLQEIADFFAQPAYASLKRFIHYREIYRPFKSVEDYNKWTGKINDPSYAHLATFEEDSLYAKQIINPLGGIRILPCGWLETGAFVRALQTLLGERKGFELIRETVGYAQIDLEARKIEREGNRYDFEQLVFAEGPGMTDNPFFSPLKIIPNKGEILFIEAPDLDLPFVLSKKVYLIPLGEARFLVGSTYANRFDDPYPSQAAREEICLHLEKAIKVPYKILDQVAGLRPTTPNRRPVLGSHPDFPYVHLIGGFGTKGVLLSPFCSKLLTAWIDKKNDLIPTEAHLFRFYK